MAINLSDFSSSGNTLTNSGGTESADLPFSTSNTSSVDLESGSSNYLYAADSASLDITTNITLEFWIKLESAVAFQAVLYKGNDNGAGTLNINYMIDLGSTGQRIRFLYSNSNAFKLYQSNNTTIIPTGTWTHVAVTNIFGSAGNCIIYVNGSAVAGTWALGTGSDATAANTYRLWVGCANVGADPSPVNYTDGIIDEVRVWNAVRTATQISNNYNIRLSNPTGETNLMAYYPFDSVASSSPRLLNLLGVGT